MRENLQYFNEVAMNAIVRTGREEKDEWKKTAALCTIHNILCYDGHELVLSSGANALRFAVEVLLSNAAPGTKSAAIKLLDQV